jgi:hypothetical protein
MIKHVIFSAYILLTSSAHSGLMINEVSTAAANDWVELFYYSPEPSTIDISKLYATMYYGSAEPLSTEPVTLYSWDRPETLWDDRYAVVYPAMPGYADETDRTGDTNGNGRIDLYCANYFASFWNTDCVAAIDTDNDPSNGGIIDFLFYSNRDGSLHSSLMNYVNTAGSFGEWIIDENNTLEFSAVNTGPKGLDSYSTLIRTSINDTNSHGDFTITSIQTPGRPNKTSGAGRKGRLFKPEKSRITIIPGDSRRFPPRVNLKIYEQCEIKARIFTAAGTPVYESPLYKNTPPGNFSIPWEPKGSPTGLYICRIEAVNTKKLLTDKASIIITLSRYR